MSACCDAVGDRNAPVREVVSWIIPSSGTALTRRPTPESESCPAAPLNSSSTSARTKFGFMIQNSHSVTGDFRVLSCRERMLVRS